MYAATNNDQASKSRDLISARLTSSTVIGIDVGKDELACCARSTSTERLLWSASYPNSDEGVQELLARAPAGTALVLEPTGRLARVVIKRAQDAGHTVLLAPPHRAKAFLRSESPRAKTDRIDSEGLSRYGLSTRLREYRLKEPTVEKVDQLLSVRKSLATTIARLTLQKSELPYAADRLTSTLSELRKQVAALDKEIQNATKDDEALLATIKLLLAVPGIGHVTATAVASRLIAKRFASADSFVAYIGLDIQINQSGRRKGEMGLSHQGDAELRRLLYLCAQSSVKCRSDPTFKAQYVREQAKGLSTTAALNAVARKLAKLCWSLHKHSSVYTPDRVYIQPNRAVAVSSEPAMPAS